MDPDSHGPKLILSAGSGSGPALVMRIRTRMLEGKMNLKKRKKVKKCIVMKCWMFSFEGYRGFSCSLDILKAQGKVYAIFKKD